MFRDDAATKIAISGPEQAHLIRPNLGHSMLPTSERSYNLLDCLDAKRQFDAAIEDRRRSKIGVQPQRGRTA